MSHDHDMSHSHNKEHVITLAVDATTSDEVVKAFEVLSRVAASLALEEVEVRLNHFVAEVFCGQCMETGAGEDL